MANLNRVILMGNLTRDPEMRYAPSGVAVTKLGLAVNTKTRKGEDVTEETCFIDVTVFGRDAETASEYLAKGRPVLIEGRLQFNRWEKDGVKHSKHEVVADRVQFLGSRTEGHAAAAGASDPDDIPF